MRNIVLISLLLIPAISAYSAEQSCITCHSRLSPATDGGHNFQDWKNSIHAIKGVGCADCHRGNPKTSDPVQSHQGVLPSRDSRSSIYFKNIPAMCGQCHKAEYEQFQKSVHYQMLQKSGRGPNCLTCHGSMTTRVLKYEEMDKTCSLCHGKPTQAAKALSMIDSAKRSIQPGQKGAFTERLQALQQKWHSFDVTAVIDDAQKLIRDITRAEQKLKKTK